MDELLNFLVTKNGATIAAIYGIAGFIICLIRAIRNKKYRVGAGSVFGKLAIYLIQFYIVTLFIIAIVAILIDYKTLKNAGVEIIWLDLFMPIIYAGAASIIPLIIILVVNSVLKANYNENQRIDREIQYDKQVDKKLSASYTKNDIFISYRTDPNEYEAVALRDYLISLGYHPYISKDGLVVGDTYEANLQNKIEEAANFILIASEETEKSRQVRNEVSLATSDSSKNIIVVKLGKFRFSRDFSYMIQDYQHLEVDNIKHAFREINASLGRRNR